MAIPVEQQPIRIGAENQVAGSDTLFDAFHTIQNNFTTLFETASPLSTFRAGDGVTVAANASNGVVSITNTGVLKLNAGSGITVSGANGNITISTIPVGPAGVTRVGLTSNSLSVTGGNIVSQGNFTVDLPRIPTGEHFSAGQYVAPTVTVDNFGRVTQIANGIGVGTVTSVGLTPGKGISVTGGPIVDSGAITVVNTGVTSVQAGRGIQVSSGNGDITISAVDTGQGSVSYLNLTSNNLTVTGGPVIDVGTFTVDLPDSFINGLYANANAANYIPTYSGNLNPNNITATNNVSANNITATNVLHANVVSANTFTGTFSGAATTAGTVTANAQPNITSLGDLVSVTTTGNANVGANLNLTGNAVISGNANMYVMTANLATVQSGLEIGNDGYVLFRTQNLSGNYVAFVPPMSVSTAGLVFMLPNTLGTSSQVLGTDGSGLLQWKTPPGVGANTQIQFNDSGISNGSSGLTFTKTSNTLTAGNLSVTGNSTASNVFATTAITAPKFVSNVATGTAPFTVSSTTQVPNLNSATAGTVITAAQPNITSTGTLTSLTVSGILTGQGNVAFSGANVTLGSNANIHISGGTSGQFLRTDGTGNLTWAAAAGFDGTQVISISNTTVSTSTTTGALKVSGGVGIAGNIYTGGNVAAIGNVTTNLSVGATGSVTYTTGTGYFVNTAGDWMKSGVYYDGSHIIINARYWRDPIAFQQIKTSIVNGKQFTVDPGGWAAFSLTATSDWVEQTMYGTGIWTINVGSSTPSGLPISKMDVISVSGVTLITGGTVVSTVVSANAINTNCISMSSNISMYANASLPEETITLSPGMVSTKFLTTVSTTYSNLSYQGTPTAGARAFITDSDKQAQGNFGAIVGGSGSYAVPIYYDGSSWRIG